MINWRRIILFISVLIIIFMSFYCVKIIFQVDNESGKADETIITSAMMTENLASVLPFSEFPASKAIQIMQYRRGFGLIGYDSWTRFEFATDADFNEFAQRVKSDHAIQSDDAIHFDYNAELPVQSREFWTVTVTGGTRATWKKGNFLQMIFSASDHRVYCICAD